MGAGCWHRDATLGCTRFREVVARMLFLHWQQKGATFPPSLVWGLSTGYSEYRVTGT